MKNLVVLGAGTAGSMMANKMAVRLPDWKVTVVDRDDVHVYQPGLLFLPFGMYRREDILKPRGALLSPTCTYVVAEVDRIDPDANVVALEDGRRLDYDLLVIATGARTRPEQTPGLMGRFWQKDVFDVYALDGALGLADRLDTFEGGRIVINVAEMPIKCPVAPLEFAFLTDAWLRERGRRDDVEVVFATPLDGAFTKPRASAAFGSMLDDRGIEVLTNFSLQRVDEERKHLTSFDGQETSFDLVLSIPLHGGSEAVVRSGLGDELGFVPTDKHTLQSKEFENVFVIGDATDVPASKAGSVAHFQGEVLVENLDRFAHGRPPEPEFDGHANCFIETGHGKAMLIDFNYETEPLPGRFPLPGVGPFALLEESEMNHWGKLAFKWVYWNVLVKGGELPLDHRMLLAGKWGG